MGILNKILSGNVDTADLFEYVTSNDFQIALAATQSPLADEIILGVAALDADKRIRIAALNNPNISDETIIRLYSDPDFEVADTARLIAERRNL